MGSSTEAITRYVAFRDYLVKLHGVVGQSSSTGANLPRMMYADRWILGGIMLGCVLGALKEHVRDGCYNLPIEEALDDDSPAAAVLATNVAVDRVHGSLAPGHYITRIRPLAVWVSADPSPDQDKPLSRRPRGEAFLWYAWPVPDGKEINLETLGQAGARRRDVAAIMRAWDRVWSECRAIQTSGTTYLTLAETEKMFSAVYALVTMIPATFLRFGHDPDAQIWEEAKSTARAAVKVAVDTGGEAVDAAADALASAANKAGEIGANAFSTFLSGLGFWGVAVVVGLVAARRMGVL